MSLSVYPSDRPVTAPAISITTNNPAEPVFVTTHDDGSIQVVDLMLVRDWADSLYQNGESWDSYFSSLYVRLPGGFELIPADLGFAGGKGSPLMVTVNGQGVHRGVLWTAEI